MKSTILLLSLALVIGFSANAQIKKGATLLGGQLGFSTNSNKYDNSQSYNSTSINISPAIGKAIRDNLVVGFDLAYNHSKDDNNLLAKSNRYGLGFFARQYKELGKGFYFFGQARLGGAYSKQEYIDNNNGQPFANPVTGYIVQVGVYPGIAYSLSKKFQLETGFNNLVYTQFSHTKNYPFSGNNNVNTSNSFSLGTSLSDFSGLTIGFRVLFN